MPDDSHGDTSVDDGATTVLGEPSDAATDGTVAAPGTTAAPAAPAAADAAPADAPAIVPAADDVALAAATAREFLCKRCAHAWDRSPYADRAASYRPTACPSCHSAYWDRAPQLQHARRPSATPHADHLTRQRDARQQRQRTRLTRILYAMDPAAALAAVRAHPPIAALLRDEPSATAPQPTITAVAAPPAEPQRVIIEVRHEPAPEPRYPWQGAGGRIDLDFAAPTLIPPPPSVATLPQFASATMAAPAPEELIGCLQPEPQL